ncbi:MAG TPA: asparagine synthase (glutamine-hydrolyzing) [Vicinamibacteria bacterium]|jgi:asparagine synthase (glutamine-hydrolysing)|nr:asparagine synthase (glutamine-hydrolyzing) [Vicinamibacteria bacterium]
MCGVAGAIRRIPQGREVAARPPSEQICAFVEKISEAQRHRGPDGSGLWQSSGREVVFGHRRLAILDLSEAGAQPMVDAETGCAITFNGEIYNFAEIRRDLEAGGETFRSSCDTEVILKAHKRWGIDAVRRFRGIFALALWDPRSRAVHLVRDPLGIKPLYWTIFRDGDTGEEVTLFASEVRALLDCGAVPRRLEPAAVASYLWHGFVVGPDTIVEGVHLLPAATILTIEAGDLTHRQNSRKMRQYWDMPSSAGGETTVEELRAELMNTVKMQLVADVPLGVFLSGGIDSSAVAALASEVVPDAVHTFTIGFDSTAYDETHYARLVADAIRSRHTSVMLTEQSFQEQLPDAFKAIDQPTFDGINTYFVSRAAREAGMTVALAGTGGDEMFGGYASFVDIPKGLRAGAWLPGAEDAGIVRRTLDSAVTVGARFVNEMSWNLLKVAPPQTRWGKVADLARAAHEALGLYQVSYALFTRETQGVLAGSAVRLAQRQQQHGLPAEVAAAWRQRVKGSEVLHAISLLELSSFVGERLLRDTDAASMAVALEVRVPLLDHVLAETVARIDPIRRFSPSRKKQLLRDVALGKLNPAIFDRPKSGFVLPIDSWARQRLRPQMETVFADEGLARRVGLRGEALQTLWRSFTGGRSGLYWSRIWAIYVLLSWCQTHEVSLPA